MDIIINCEIRIPTVDGRTLIHRPRSKLLARASKDTQVVFRGPWAVGPLVHTHLKFDRSPPEKLASHKARIVLKNHSFFRGKLLNFGGARVLLNAALNERLAFHREAGSFERKNIVFRGYTPNNV